MVKCGICGGEAPRQPGITDEREERLKQTR